ncbi:hypothetical protein DXA36_08810 [Eisenbergiella sp. OF01-20]|nr:hypothetical protein DXA36_08810 [Eisenbergiella sp. OF01-20]
MIPETREKEGTSLFPAVNYINLSKITDGYRREYAWFRQKMRGLAAIINPCKQSYNTGGER